MTDHRCVNDGKKETRTRTITPFRNGGADGFQGVTDGLFFVKVLWALQDALHRGTKSIQLRERNGWSFGHDLNGRGGTSPGQGHTQWDEGSTGDKSLLFLSLSLSLSPQQGRDKWSATPIARGRGTVARRHNHDVNAWNECIARAQDVDGGIISEGRTMKM